MNSDSLRWTNGAFGPVLSYGFEPPANAENSCRATDIERALVLNDVLTDRSMVTIV
jgi:hypothetical protein